MPAPSLAAAVKNAVEFSQKYPIITVTIYQCRKAGSPIIEGYVPFVSRMEPEQLLDGLLYVPLGTFKGGREYRESRSLGDFLATRGEVQPDLR